MLSLGSVVTIISVVKAAQCCSAASQSICLHLPLQPRCGKSQRKERAAVQGLGSVLRSPESAPSVLTRVPVTSDKSLHLGDAGSGLKTLLWSSSGAAQGHPLAWGSYSGPLTPGLKTLNPKVRFLESLVTEETTASQSCWEPSQGCWEGQAPPPVRGAQGGGDRIQRDTETASFPPTMGIISRESCPVEWPPCSCSLWDHTQVLLTTQLPNAMYTMTH